MKGGWTEERALSSLQQKGYRLLGRNRLAPFGEIDLLMEKEGACVVVEVKQRRSAAFGTPLKALTPNKVEKFLKSARYLLGRDDLPVRFEAVLVHGSPEAHRIEHLALEV